MDDRNKGVHSSRKSGANILQVPKTAGFITNKRIILH